LIVADNGPELDVLEKALFANPEPKAVGIGWWWRCLDYRLDFWPRASIMALSFDNTFALVDFTMLEQHTSDIETRGKDFVRRLLCADHLLKVAWHLSDYNLRILQRAVVPAANLYDENVVFPVISPFIDLAHVAGCVQKCKALQPVSLSHLAWDYLRIELCQAERCSNWDRRPLRDTQYHYALTYPHCPVVILRVMCANQLITPEKAECLFFKAGSASLGRDGKPRDWIKDVRKLSLYSDSDNYRYNAQPIQGPYKVNVWDGQDEACQDFIRRVHRHDKAFTPRDVLRVLSPFQEWMATGRAREFAAKVLRQDLSNRDLASKGVDKILAASE